MKVENIDELLILNEERRRLESSFTSNPRANLIITMKIRAINAAIEEYEAFTIEQLKVMYVNPMVTRDAIAERVLLEEKHESKSS